jgi:hypothetical protein
LEPSFQFGRAGVAAVFELGEIPMVRFFRRGDSETFVAAMYVVEGNTEALEAMVISNRIREIARRAVFGR